MPGRGVSAPAPPRCAHPPPLVASPVLQYVFMDQTSYEETRVVRDDDWAKYLKEGAICNL